ncbi:MAG: class I SAM-dependent methyltransferase [Acidobacteria bacterium]|nr:class I SAM-dependent methyltransferase [Acidobacteriota bacterium]
MDGLLGHVVPPRVSPDGPRVYSAPVDEFISRLFADPAMLRMGHAQRAGDLNLGLGWIYYALARVIRPRTAVVIGSWRGFVPAILGKALADNSEGGEVVFVDPSFVDDFWSDSARVTGHFASLGAPNVRHVRATTQEFVATEEYRHLAGVGMAMVDGFHTAEQARFDYLAMLPKLAPEAVTLFHDSVRRWESPIYGKDRPYEHTVCLLMHRLRETPGLEVLSFPFDGGLTLVRGLPSSLEAIEAPFEPGAVTRPPFGS